LLLQSLNMAQQIKQGKGWRLGWNPEAVEFQGLVGGEDWAIELTAAELDDFCRLTAQLSGAITAMAAELMAEEQISCEVETSLLWLEAEGYAQAYMMRLILHTGRRGEGRWSPAAVPELLQAAQTLRVF
jgi:hypothetical protein